MLCGMSLNDISIKQNMLFSDLLLLRIDYGILHFKVDPSWEMKLAESSIYTINIMLHCLSYYCPISFTTATHAQRDPN